MLLLILNCQKGSIYVFQMYKALFDSLGNRRILHCIVLSINELKKKPKGSRLNRRYTKTNIRKYQVLK